VKVPPVLVYSVLRLLAFLVPLGLMLLLPIFRQNWLLAVVFAALIGLSLSLLFLRQPRAAVAQGLATRRTNARTQIRDEDAEDDLSADERPREERGVAE
jgi:hypothetical protein